MSDKAARVKLPDNIPGLSIAVTSGGEIAWARGFGVTEAGRAEPVTPGTLFQACSVSKAVTAVAVMRLVQERVLGLDNDVNNYLVSWRVPARRKRQPAVTVRQLLSHTAGVNFPWSAGYHREQEVPTLLEVLNGDKPSNHPAVEVTGNRGRRFSYSAGGYCILQQLLVDVMNVPFPQLMSELVLGPLAMEHSTFEQPLPERLWDRAATGHRANGNPVAGKWRVYPEMAAAGLWTTPSDLARLALDLQRALSGKPSTVLSQETVELMLAPQAKAADQGQMALGAYVDSGASGVTFGHPGDNEGYTARWISTLDDTHEPSGVVIMTNSDAGWEFQNSVLEMLFKEEDTHPH